MGYYYTISGEMRISDTKNLERAREIILDAFEDWREAIRFYPREDSSVVDIDIDDHNEHRYDGAEEEALNRIRAKGLLLDDDDYVAFETCGEDGEKSLIELGSDGEIVEKTGEPIWEVSSEDLAAELVRRGDLDDALVRHGASVKLLHNTVRLRVVQNGVGVIFDPVPASGINIWIDDAAGEVRVMVWRDQNAIKPTDIIEFGGNR